MIRLSIIIILIGLMSCNSESERPADVLGQDKMTDVIRDITIAETYVDFFLKKDTTISKDTLLKREIEKVLTLHNTDVKTFSSSYTYYRNHPELFKLIVDSASRWFTKDRTSLLQKVN